MTTTIWDQEHEQISQNLQQPFERMPPTSPTFETITAEDREKERRGKMKPSIGIVVLTHDRDIGPVVESIMDQMDTNHDLCIVEGGSSKEWVAKNREICLRKDIKHHWVPYKGKETAAHGRNVGALRVEGEYLYFIDGDCIMEWGTLAEMEDSASPEAITVGRVVFQQPDGTQLDDHRLPQFGHGHKVTTYPWMMDEKNVMIPRSLFYLVSGFDVSWAANSYCWEGVDLYCRLYILTGVPMILVRNAVVTHIQDKPKNPDQAKSDENMPLFLERLQKYIEKYPEIHTAQLNRWRVAIDGGGYDRR